MFSIFIYHSAFLLSSIFGFFSTKKIVGVPSKWTKLFFAILSFLIIMILNGTRDGVGTDYGHYKWIFDLAQKGEEYPIVEPGYWFINVAFRNFEHGYRYVLGLICLVTYLILFRIAIEEKVLALTIPFLFSFGFIFFSNNIVRQSLVISIFIYSIRFIENKKFWLYFLCIIFSFFFHVSAILLLPFYWLGKLRLPSFYWGGIVLLSVFLYKLNVFYKIITAIASFFPKYSGFIGKAGLDDFTGGFGLTLVLLIFLGISVSFFGKRSKLNERHKIYFNFFMVGICFSIMLFGSAYFYRFTFYLFYLVFLIIPIIIKNIKASNVKLFAFVFFFLFSLIWWIKSLMFNDGTPIPYQSFLF